jgi:hypothetical protein
MVVFLLAKARYSGPNRDLHDTVALVGEQVIGGLDVHDDTSQLASEANLSKTRASVAPLSWRGFSLGFERRRQIARLAGGEAQISREYRARGVRP